MKREIRGWAVYQHHIHRRRVVAKRKDHNAFSAFYTMTYKFSEFIALTDRPYFGDGMRRKTVRTQRAIDFYCEMLNARGFGKHKAIPAVMKLEIK